MTTDSLRGSVPSGSYPVFRCTSCGAEFRSLPPPAETRPDDAEKLCDVCIEAMLDSVPEEPITDAKVEQILSYVRSGGYFDRTYQVQQLGRVPCCCGDPMVACDDHGRFMCFGCGRTVTV